MNKRVSACRKTRSAVLRIVLRSVTCEQHAPLARDSRALRLIVFRQADISPPPHPLPPFPKHFQSLIHEEYGTEAFLAPAPFMRPLQVGAEDLKAKGTLLRDVSLDYEQN